MPALELAMPNGGRRVVVLDRERTTIGRSKENDIFLPDRWLSRRHAEILQVAEGYYVVDLGSKNGTLVNDQRVRERLRLRSGDVITLGEHALTFSGDGTDKVAEESETEPVGTQVFSVRELSREVRTPSSDARSLARQNHVLRVLSAAAEALLVHRPLTETFDLVLDLIFEAVAAERAAILLTKANGETEIKAQRVRSGPAAPRISRSIARRVLEERAAVLIPNVLEDMTLKGQESVVMTGVRSAICAPLWLSGAAQDTVIGLVYIDTQRTKYVFDTEDLSVVAALANLAAAKIENARLLEESLEKRRLEADVKAAAEIQARLLPAEAPVLAGWGLVGSTRACHTVGGDYYDFECSAGNLLLALGDVSGKGMGAALLMAVLRASVRGQWAESGCADAVARINRTICQNVPSNKYVTFFLARLDPASGSLCYVNAGHNPPLLLRADGGVERLSEGGMVLGLFDSVPYAEASVTLKRGDVLVIYSDGVTEAFSEDGTEFGEAAVARVAGESRHEPAAAIHERLLAAVEAYDGGKAVDDRTLLVLKRD